MTKSLHILIVEDSASDAGLVVRQIELAGYEVRWARVETATDLKAALQGEEWDVILCDYSMPDFSGTDALAIIRATGLDVPVIFVSGTMGEDVAVEAMKAGAHDYVMKDNLKRLVPAIERELQEASVRRQRREAEQSLAAQQAVTGILAEADTLGEAGAKILQAIAKNGEWEAGEIWTVDRQSEVLRCLEIWHAAGKPLGEFATRTRAMTFARGVGLPGRVWASGQPAWIADVTQDANFPRAVLAAEAGLRGAIGFPIGLPIVVGHEVMGVIAFFRTTPGQPDEKLLALLNDIGSQIGQFLVRQQAQEELKKLASAVKQTANCVCITNRAGVIEYVNPAFEQTTGYPREEVIGKTPRLLKSGQHDQKFYEAVWNTVLAGGTFSAEFINRNKSGKLYHTEQSITPIRDTQGHITHFVSTGHDITERKRAETERRVIFEIIQGSTTKLNLGEFLRLVHRSIGQLVYAENCFVMLHDPVNNINHFEFWVDKYDPPPAPHLAGKGFSSYVLRTGKPLLITEESKKRIIKAGEAEQIGSASASWLGVPLRTPSRTIGVLVLQHYEVEHAYSERDLEFLSSVGDEIALAVERRRADEALTESEERYRELVENAIDVIYAHDLNGNYTSVNQAVETITGYTRDETLAMNMAKIVAPDYLEKAKEMMAAKLAGKDVTAYELEIIAKDGRRVAVEINSRIIHDNGTPVHIQGIARDITERKRAEEAISTLRRELELTMSSMGEGVHRVDLNGNIVFENPAAARMLGWEIDQLLGKPAHLTMHHTKPDGTPYPVEECPIYATFRDGVSRHVADEVFWRQDGTSFPVEYMTAPIRNDQNEIVAAVVTFRDITERKRSKDALKLFRALVDQSNDTIEVVDPETGRFLDVNEKGHLALGYSREEFLALSVFDLDPTVDQSAFPGVVEELRKSGALTWEGIHRRKDGSTFPVEVNLRYVQLDRDYVVAVVRDITERKRADEALRSSESRLRAIIDTEPECVKLLAKNGSLLEMNPAGLRMIEADSFADVENKCVFPLIVEEHRKAFRDLTNKVFRGESGMLEFQIVGLKGTHRWLDTHASPLRDATGKITALLGITRDVTERKRAEEAIRESEEKYRTILENIEDGYFEVDIAGNFTFFNDSLCGILGYPRDEMLGMNNREYMDDQNAKKVFQTFNEVSRTGKPADVFDWEVIRKDGNKRFAEASVSLRKDSTGQPIGFRGIVRDITGRKGAEEQLRLHATALEAAANSIIITDRDGTIAWVNPAFTDVTGYALDEVLGQNPSILKSGELDAAFYKTLWDTILSGRAWQGEMINRRKDGTTYYEEQTITPVMDEAGEIINFIAIKQDVTERRRAEAKILSEQLFSESIVNSLPSIFYLFDQTGKFLRWNKNFEQITGYSAKEIPTLSPLDLFAGEEKELIAQRIQEVFTSGAADAEAHLVSKNGQRTSYYFTGVRIDSDDQPCLIGVGLDIAERERAVEALSDSEERYRDLVENARDIIYTHDFDGNYTSASKAVEDILGYTIEEALTKNMSEIVAPEYFEKAGQMMADMRAGKEAAVSELEVFAKDGHRVTVEINARLIEENGVPVGIQGVARDVTERKHLEEQFLQSQKMEGIGMLAGGIAHDFNNLLTAINGYSDLTLKRMPADDPFRHNIGEIKDAGQRAAALTGQLLAFSRKQILKPTVHNVNTVIENLERMLQRIIRENIELKTVLDPELGNINADPVQIEQVIMNLAVNARDAMPIGGTLTIETQNVFLDAEVAGMSFTLAPGPFVKIIFTDTGEGMDEKTRQRIFEPFFTTKAVGQGTGLGLSTVHGIIKQSGGNIAVYSKPGHGTTFKIYLPCVDKTVQKTMWRGNGKENYSGTETILLVEDQDIVRNMVRDILTGNGYRVLEADSGQAALSVCDDYSDPIHMLLSDLIMPGMSGVELRDQLVKLRPDVKVLIMSGYTDDSIADSGILVSDTPFIEKPFTPDALARKVREALES